MQGRNPIGRRAMVFWSIAGLLAMVGRRRDARDQFILAGGGRPGTELLVFDPKSPRFADLTRGFNRRWTAPNCTMVLVPLSEAGAQAALTEALA